MSDLRRAKRRVRAETCASPAPPARDARRRCRQCRCTRTAPHTPRPARGELRSRNADSRSAVTFSSVKQRLRRTRRDSMAKGWEFRPRAGLRDEAQWTCELLVQLLRPWRRLPRNPEDQERKRSSCLRRSQSLSRSAWHYLFLETRLLENTAQRSGSQIVAPLSGNRHATGLRRMLELTVTAFGRNQVPPITRKHCQDFRYLQRT